MGGLPCRGSSPNGDVMEFCRRCLNCVTRWGPGHSHCPPLKSIPVKGPFHRVGVDILQLPLTSRSNKYIVVFMDYLTKWVEAFPTPVQETTTIANLLIEYIICQHRVPEEFLSDRGTNFLSDLILKLCSIKENQYQCIPPSNQWAHCKAWSPNQLTLMEWNGISNCPFYCPQKRVHYFWYMGTTHDYQLALCWNSCLLWM